MPADVMPSPPFLTSDGHVSPLVQPESYYDRSVVVGSDGMVRTRGV